MTLSGTFVKNFRSNLMMTFCSSLAKAEMKAWVTSAGKSLGLKPVQPRLKRTTPLSADEMKSSYS
jgi:hypothetical protein